MAIEDRNLGARPAGVTLRDFLLENGVHPPDVDRIEDRGGDTWVVFRADLDAPHGAPA